jgi:hypothetical protein
MFMQRKTKKSRSQQTNTLCHERQCSSLLLFTLAQQRAQIIYYTFSAITSKKINVFCNLLSRERSSPCRIGPFWLETMHFLLIY